jgi:membrane protein implicated in regulation of membrane protease activity
MSREEVIQEMGRPFLMPLGIMQMLCLLAFISTPFIWMWFDWSLAWRIGLSGLISAILVYGVYKVVKNAINEIVTEELDKIEGDRPTTSIFQEKLNKAMESLRQVKAN